jgi:glycosyltransferase involved in cell wall biosynthesis
MSRKSTHAQRPGPSVLMLGTFGVRPKGTMSARAAGIGAAAMRCGWNARIVTTPWDNPGDAGTSTTIEGVKVQNTRNIRPGLWPLPVFEMVRAANAFQPDVIHLFKPKGFGDLAARILRWSGFPVVVDMDDWEGTGGWNDVLPYSQLQKRVFDCQETSWPSIANGMTVASTSLLQRAIALGARLDDVLYLPNRLTHLRADQLLNPPGRSWRDYPALRTATPKRGILLYTRFTEFEPEFLIDVVKNISRTYPGIRLIIAGKSSDGNAEARLQSLADQTGLADQIVSLGWIDPRDLAWIASRCDAALVPFEDTLINRAKCSVKLLELIVTGIPIVASNVGENRSYMRMNSSGRLARPGDATHHSELLIDLMSEIQPERRSNSLPVESVTWEHCAPDIISLYQRSIARALNVGR